MRILYICHRIPFPPDKGEKIRAFHQIRELSRNHEVDVFTLADQAEDVGQREALAKYCHRVEVVRLHPRMARILALPGLLTRTPLTLPYFYSTRLASSIREAMAARSYDRIFVYCSAMAQYVEHVRTAPVLMDFVDVDSDKWLQYAPHKAFPMSAICRREGRLLREYERKIIRRVDRVIVTTDREAQLVRQIVPGAHVDVLPMGVDVDHFTNEPGEVSKEPGIVFVGDMGYFPNQQATAFFAREVLPLILIHIPAARFRIVGRSPSRDVLALQELPGVEVTGTVPDVRPYLAQARVSVAPFLIAAGIQTKILEALASGLPVVSTPKTLQGLTPGVAEVIATGETPARLAEVVVELLKNPERARALGAEGRRRVHADYSWEVSGKQLSEMVADPFSIPGGAALSTAKS